MQRTALWTTFLALNTVFAWGCGAKDDMSTKDRLLAEVDEDVDLYEDLTGIDETDVKVPVEDKGKPEMEPTETMPETEGEPIEGPRGAFVGTILIGKEPVAGSYSVKTITGQPEIVVADAAAGTETPLDPGVYDVVFTVTALNGNPTMTLREIKIPTSRRIRREANMPAGEIVLVTGPGKCKKQKIRIKDVGASDWYEGDFFTCEPIHLRAGEYSAEMGPEKNPIPIEGIQVYDGSKRNMHVQR